MTADKFSYFLKNPGHLYQLSYQELKSLVVQYPYCQNFRYLLLIKSKIENSEDYQKDLALAATYHVDRNHLYQLINQEEQAETADNFILEEDYLELKDLSVNPIEQTDIPQASLLLEHQEEIIAKEEALELPNLKIPSTADLTNSIIPKEGINETSSDELEEEEYLDGSDELELTDTSDIDIPTSSLQEDSIEEESADNISDEPEMLSYMEKPKKSKSVIDQLLGKEKKKGKKLDGKIISISSEKEINPEDELESFLDQKENDFKDLTPIKETPKVGKEVLFEITNKTDKELEALMQKANQIDEEETINENLGYLDSKQETITEDSVKPVEGSAPAPKTSFKSYLDKFQPPPGVIEDLDKNEIANVIDETLEEENEEVGLIFIKKKKSKKKKKKLMSKIKMKKKEKEAKKMKKDKKEKKKKKKKARVIAEANKSVQQSDDVLSETLAELLVMQGSQKKAIKMYKRLSLIFPKKSSFFAKKIAKLKK